MLERGDVFVYVLLVLIAVIWLLVLSRRKRAVSVVDVPTSGKVVQLLRSEGYEIVSGKIKLPLLVSAGGEEAESHLTADFLVKSAGRTYVVKVERKQSEPFHPKRVQERYLPVCLAFKAHGVVRVDASRGKLAHADIDIGRFSSNSRWRSTVFSFLLGVAITFFWLY